MAGGKETPRQKMIGMMYLVLTALLALNVSKQIISAFITLNDKIETSVVNVHEGTEDLYSEFDQKAAVLRATKGDMREFNVWNDKAANLRGRTNGLVSYILSECNEMIKASEGSDWVEERDESGNIISLKSLDEITSMDNYDVPTNMFVGGNPSAPNSRGMAIRDSIHAFRDLICESVATYQYGKTKFSFESPERVEDLANALSLANPMDTAFIAQMYRTLTIPEKLPSHDHGADAQPWSSVTFDHAPIVAAAAMFTSIRLDVKNAESKTADYMLRKITAPIVTINKIEPLAFAPSNYVNQNDGLGLNVFIAAWDSTQETKIRYGIDADTLPEKWIETNGRIDLSTNSPGNHTVHGAIGVRERGELNWKPWSYKYTVGQPMGVVAMPEMRNMYWGYDNIIEGTASGFPPDRIKLTTNGCRLTKRPNGQFVARVERGVRNASITVNGINEDGSTVSLGTYNFTCKSLPPATLYFGRTESGETMRYAAAKEQKTVRVALHPSVPLSNVNYEVLEGTVRVESIPGIGNISKGGRLDDKAQNLMRQSRGKTVNIDLFYKGPDNVKRGGSMSFKVS